MATFTDIRTDFRRNPVTGDVDLFFDEESIANAIKNLVFFGKNSVVFKPEIPIDIEAELFELVSPITADSIKNRIRDGILNFEPRVEQVDVQVRPIKTEDGYDITITYLPKKAISPVSVNFFLKRVV